MPGDQEQPQRALHVNIGQRLAVLVPGIHQRRDQIVGRVLLALLDMAGEIGGHVVDRAHQRVVILDPQFEDLVDPLDEQAAVLFRDAEHMGDRPHRNVLGIARRGVAFSVIDEFIDQFVADGANPGFELLHGVGRERRQQQLLGGLVLRRIGGDRRRRSRRLGPHVADDDAARGKMFGVVGDLLSPLHRWSAGSNQGNARCGRPGIQRAVFPRSETDSRSSADRYGRNREPNR